MERVVCREYERLRGCLEHLGHIPLWYIYRENPLRSTSQNQTQPSIIHAQKNSSSKFLNEAPDYSQGSRGPCHRRPDLCSRSSPSWGTQSRLPRGRFSRSLGSTRYVLVFLFMNLDRSLREWWISLHCSKERKVLIHWFPRGSQGNPHLQQQKICFRDLQKRFHQLLGILHVYHWYCDRRIMQQGRRSD